MIRRFGATCATRPLCAGTTTIAAWWSWPRRPRDARELLRSYLGGDPRPGVFSGRKPYGRGLKIAFVYDGPAEKWKSFGEGLARSLPGFASTVGSCDDVLQGVLGWRLSPILHEAAASDGRQQDRPALLALQLALTAWWRNAGVTPDVVVGPGAGELAAACAAGILTTKEALRLAANHERDGVIPPPPQPRAAVLPFLSAVDGQSHAGPDLGPAHWHACLHRPQDGNSVTKAISQREIDFCIGLGGGGTSAGQPSLETLAPSLANLGLLYAAGVDLTWGPLAPANGRCVSLPAYPWQRQRLWAPKNQWNLPASVAAETSPSPVRSPRPDLNTPYVAPQAGLETTLAEIWEGVLQVDRVGVHDNFFALGGHSLLAAQVASRIAGRVRADLPLREMFQSPTIAELAQRIDSVSSGGLATRVPPIVPVPRRRGNAALLYPGSALVPRPIGTRPGDIHDLFPLADHGPAQHDHGRTDAERDIPETRILTDPFPGSGRPPHPGDRTRGAAPACDRRLGLLARGPTRFELAAVDRRGDAKADRPSERAPDPHYAAAGWRRKTTLPWPARTTSSTTAGRWPCCCAN